MRARQVPVDVHPGLMAYGAKLELEAFAGHGGRHIEAATVPVVVAPQTINPPWDSDLLPARPASLGMTELGWGWSAQVLAGGLAKVPRAIQTQ